MPYDIVVVGAGGSGLITADRLAAQGYDVVVLEARDRVGGRTHTVDVPDHPGYRIDVGGQWVGPDQRELLEELDRFGLTTRDQGDGREPLPAARPVLQPLGNVFLAPADDGRLRTTRGRQRRYGPTR